MSPDFSCVGFGSGNETIGPEERQQKCEVGVVARRWCCSAHTGNEVSSCVGSVWNGHEGVCILAWWKLCDICGNACGLLVDFGGQPTLC